MKRKEMKGTKKWRRMLAITAVVCGALCCGAASESVTAAEQMSYEIEENDIQSKATALELNTTYVGNTSDKEDVDWYEFEIPEGSKGYFNVTLEPDEDANTDQLKDGWNLGIYQKREADSFLTYGQITSTFKTRNLPLAPGKYCIKIKAEDSYDWTSENYNLRIDYVNNINWESEDLEDKQDANQIEVNRTYYGNLTYASDVDWFEFSIAEHGTLVLNLEPDEDANTDELDDGWNVKIYRANEADEFEYLTGVKGPKSTYDMFLDAGKYRIKVCAQDTYDAPIRITYNLKLDYIQGGDVEHELNDTMSTANEIATDVTYTGNMKKECNDKDYFVFTPSVTGNVTLDFKRDITSNPRDGYNIYILNGNNKELAKVKGMTDESAIVGSASVTAGTNYYVLITNNDAYDQIEGVNYHFSLKVAQVESTLTPVNTPTPAPVQSQPQTSEPVITQKPADTTITTTKVSLENIKTEKKKVYLRWKRNSYATGYKIYRSTKIKGKYICIKTIKKAKVTSYYDKKVKKGKTYYYKIRAYKKAGKRLIYSGYSPAKRVKVK